MSGWPATDRRILSVNASCPEVQTLQQVGSEVIVLSIDWTDGAQIKSAVKEAVFRFGHINGVIDNARLLG